MKTDLSNRTVASMLFFGWLTWLLVEPLANVVDDYTTAQPWFDVELSVDDGTVHYTRTINRWMRGEWTAQVQIQDTADGWITTCDRSGAWTYRPTTAGTISMGFGRFTGGCQQPEQPHRVCTDYVMEDIHGRRRAFGAFCSPLHEPRG